MRLIGVTISEEAVCLIEVTQKDRAQGQWHPNLNSMADKRTVTINLELSIRVVKSKSLFSGKSLKV